MQITKVLLVGLLISLAGDQDCTGARDDQLLNQLGTIHGTIILLNHPTLGRTSSGVFEIYFESVACKATVVGIKSDLTGKYMIHLTPGRYRLLSRYVFNHTETANFLARSQPRFIEVEANDYQRFDVELRLPQ